MLFSLACILASTSAQLLNVQLSTGIDEEVENYIHEYKWNQDLMQDLVDDYEVVYPFQIRDRSRVGIDTRNHFYQNSSIHFDKCSFVIKSSYGRFRLHVELNSFVVPDLAIFKYFVNDSTQFTIRGKNMERCFYQGIVHGEEDSKVTISTCQGLLGAITANNQTYFIVPIKGGDLGKRHPHMLIKAKWHQKFSCGNSGSTEWSNSGILSTSKHFVKRDVSTDTKYLELAVVLDFSTFSYMDLDFKLLTQFVVESINGLDLIFKHTFETRVSLVYLEIWMHKSQNFFSLNDDITQSLLNLIDYSSKKLYDEPKDVLLFITSHKFHRQEITMAVSGNVCTSKSAGIVQITSRFETFRLSVQMSHNVAHILGVRHDEDVKYSSVANCDCSQRNGCLMNGRSISGKRSRFSTEFSRCSIDDYTNALRSGQASCLFNKPLQASQLLLCGNKKVDPGEICDCGSSEECDLVDPCCDPITCTLRQGAECGAGECCEGCKIITIAKMCRPAADDCDVPEFCSGSSGQCPPDAHKLDGVDCGEVSDGYCYVGRCQTLNKQCKLLWGPDASVAEKECFEKMNMANLEPGVAKTVGNSMCSYIHCRGGWEVPTLPVYSKTEFAEHKKVFECKSASNGNKSASENNGLVKDGTKCLQNRICVDSLCVHLNAIAVDPKCPSNHVAWPCSGHGVCTNLHWCYCNAGWSSEDCSVKSYDIQSTTQDAYSASSIMSYSTPKTIAPSFEPLDNMTSSLDNLFSSLPFSLRLDTYTMLVILGGVAGGIMLLLLFLALCYRRRTKSKLRGAKRTNKAQSFNRTLERRNSESSIETAHRSIRFGDMPSYRDEKVQQKRRRQHERLLAQVRYANVDSKTPDLEPLDDSRTSYGSSSPNAPTVTGSIHYGTNRERYGSDCDPYRSVPESYDFDQNLQSETVSVPKLYSTNRKSFKTDSEQYERTAVVPSKNIVANGGAFFANPRPSPACSRVGSENDPYGRYAGRGAVKAGEFTIRNRSTGYGQQSTPIKEKSSSPPYAATSASSCCGAYDQSPSRDFGSQRRSRATRNDRQPIVDAGRYAAGAVALSVRELDACDIGSNDGGQSSRSDMRMIHDVENFGDLSKGSDQESPLNLAHAEPLKLNNIEYLLRHLNQQQTDAHQNQSNSDSLSSGNDPDDSLLRNEHILNVSPLPINSIARNYCNGFVPSLPSTNNSDFLSSNKIYTNDLNIVQCSASTADAYYKAQRRPTGWPVDATRRQSPRRAFNNIATTSPSMTSPPPSSSSPLRRRVVAVAPPSSFSPSPLLNRVALITPPAPPPSLNATSSSSTLKNATPLSSLDVTPSSTLRNATPTTPLGVAYRALRAMNGGGVAAAAAAASSNICASCSLPTPSTASSCGGDGRASSDGSCDNNVCVCKLTNLNVLRNTNI